MATVQFLPNEAIVTIQLNGAYYADIQALLIYLSESVSKEELAKQIGAMQNKTPLSEFGKHLETLLILANEVESQAKIQNLIQEKEVIENLEGS